MKLDTWWLDTAEFIGPVTLVSERIPRVWFDGFGLTSLAIERTGEVEVIVANWHH